MGRFGQIVGAILLAIVGLVLVLFGLAMAPLVYENGVMTSMSLPVGLSLVPGIIAISFSVVLFRDASKAKR